MPPRRTSSLGSRARALREDATPVERLHLPEARRVFERLGRRRQLQVAADIVATRSRELILAYPDVLRVSYGYRRKRARRRHRVVQEPCVRFLVHGKWDDRARTDERRRIPEFLFAMCWVRGRPRICAVPTDVEDAAPHLQVRAQAEPVVAVWNGATENGVLVCAVRRDILPDRVYGLGCRHVLSLSGQFFDATTWGAEVHLGAAASATIIGPTRALAGDLGASDSFDAQLVEARDRDALRDALLPGLADYARSAADLPPAYTIRTPTQTIDADFVDIIDGHYDLNGHDVGHPNLVQSQPQTGTSAGHSGSPVTTRDGRTLLGMHVAGWAGLDPQGHFLAIAYMIPAWHLFEPARYRNTTAGERWTLVAP